MSRLKWAFIAVAILLVASVAWIAYSQYTLDLSLKKALGLSELPKSIKDSHVKVHDLIDHIIEGYFEISPPDFEKLLTARKYTKVTDLSEKQAKPNMLTLPTDFVVSDSYKWTGSKSTDCIISTDSSKTKATVVYFKHFY